MGDKMIVKQIISPKPHLRVNTLSIQTAWTGFDPYLHSGGSSLVGSTRGK